MKKLLPMLLLVFVFSMGIIESKAQVPPGIQEINEGKNMMARNFRALSSAVLVLGALFGLLGGLRVYNNWQLGRRNIDVEVAGWFGACIFLSVLGVFLSALYQVPLA
ncbi:DUF4134 family protein [Pleomorphovibrio marinus]|uniref:DUF4134 family protein n=1 Tax=Pleomorphovibrio marinus TaxID=2164132 RepID=UPI000E0AF2C5|nr:DUF4134 family protein [Pleomorphovibrio marinus]